MLVILLVIDSLRERRGDDHGYDYDQDYEGEMARQTVRWAACRKGCNSAISFSNSAKSICC